MTSTFATYPMDVLCLRLAVKTGSKTMSQVALSMLREEGFASFYTGLGPSLVLIAPYIAINFCIFDLMKKSLLEKYQKRPETSVVTALVSASLATVMCYPRDTVRRQMQMKGSPYNTLLDAFPAKKTFSHLFQECSKLRELKVGRQAHAQMMTTGFSPTVFVANCLVHMYIRCMDLGSARKVFDDMPHRDIVSWNAIVFGYAQNGFVDLALSLFSEMPVCDVISWNSIISGCLQNGNLIEAAELFLEMRMTGMASDRTTFAIVLKLSSALEDHAMGTQIHGLVIKVGLDMDVVAGSAVVDMYAKNKNLGDSYCFFREMPQRNWVTWSALIGGCAKNEEFICGLELFVEMQREGIPVSQSSYASIFRSCAGLSCLEAGRQLHGNALKNDFISDIIVGTAILDMYAKCESLGDAKKLFRELPIRSLQTCNAMLVGFTRNDLGIEALKLFQSMNSLLVGADEISLSAVLSACAEAKAYLQGLQVHCLAIKTNLFLNICVTNSMLDMYGKCRALADACNVFEEMSQRDAVSWNAVLTALEQNECYEETLSYFNQMLVWGLEPDVFTYGTVLKACAALQSLNFGMQIHNMVMKAGLGLDPFVGCSLIDMYCKCGMLEAAQGLHKRIVNPTIVSWNSIISGFSLHKQSEEAQNVFSWMLEIGLQPDNFTYASALDTCSNLATVGLGKQIHAHIIKKELNKDVFISSTLVDMYAKSGNMQDSQLMFEKMLERDFVSWNAIICGYANHGFGMEALRMFERMQMEKIVPNHATFLAVLRACGHAGLVDEGLHYFESMTQHYCLEPQLEHYSCMVDLLGRTKGVHEALEVIACLPFEADAVIWRTLLSVCQIHRNVEVAELAVRNILALEPNDPSALILLSNIYAQNGRWDEVSGMRRMMRESSMKKEPGCSWIEVKGEMYAFIIQDNAHPNTEQIYDTLDKLVEEMSQTGSEPDQQLFIHEESNKI
ncbi:Pentatricopeptide repeat-containing protein [Apostasia shenzhenica]|uniref:Pentatricopeptide repeat-containing protein n=1 Tax=Apostasia shenzhenica TaxID=1088818 RepID=A0A2I0A930_9ASPA|nr:Pentatricopeptide repeat-containing protein [Apostasia shenzhenica]